jgi:hypothetical protein
MLERYRDNVLIDKANGGKDHRRTLHGGLMSSATTPSLKSQQTL